MYKLTFSTDHLLIKLLCKPKEPRRVEEKISSLTQYRLIQARLQQYVNRELPDVQAGFRKGRGTRDQIANICWIIKNTEEFQKNIYFCFIDYAKAFDCGITADCGTFLKRWEYQTT